jgi:hypothetical protein
MLKVASGRVKRGGQFKSRFGGHFTPRIYGQYTRAFHLISSERSLTSDELSRLISLRRETCWSFRTKVINVMGNRKKFNNPLEGWKELILINPVTSKRKIENKLPN